GSFYAVLTLLAALFVGCTTQSNSMAETGKSSFHLAPSLTGFLAAILAGLVIVGGIRSIGKVCVRLVPVLAILFTGSCLLLLFLNRTCLFPAIALILKDAFTGKAIGSGLSTGSLMNVLRYGIARGLFTNEAGIGTSSIMAATSSEESPSRQAYVSMTAVFWDTVVMCLLSGLVIVTNILKRPQSVLHASQGTLTDAAFSSLPFFGNGFLSVCLIAFALTTLIGWSYLGESAVTYLTGGRGLFLYKVAYIVMIYIGAILPLQTVWECTDLINACMVIPNVLALFLLRREIQIT
ncbi:alanine:cation symporter family protein, partial [Suilimivivens sp.]|uniref:alanine/glycine:cation symporter family protein n=1 Tax=Suilimivivens sp. TaxID=2981669 RepID=UPI00307BFB33